MNLKNISYFTKNNMVIELKELQQNSKLTGHCLWSYQTNEPFVECTVRNAITAVHENIVRRLFDAGLSPDDQVLKEDKKKITHLSRRELQCAICLLKGKTSLETASLLYISPRTVEVYILRLRKRFGSKNRIQLVKSLLESGLLPMVS